VRDRPGFSNPWAFGCWPALSHVGAVLAVYATISFRSTKEDLLGFVRADLERSSRLINRATTTACCSTARRTCRRRSNGWRKRGNRRHPHLRQGRHDCHVSTEGGDRRRIALDSETCRSCHREGKRRGEAVLERTSLTRVDAGPEVLRHLSVIENEPSCATAACHAHPADQRSWGSSTWRCRWLARSRHPDRAAPVHLDDAGPDLHRLDCGGDLHSKGRSATGLPALRGNAADRRRRSRHPHRRPRPA